MTTLIHKKSDNSLRMPGVDFGKMTLVAHNARDKIIAARVEGGKVWSGRGMGGTYAPTHFVVFLYDGAATTTDGGEETRFSQVRDTGSLSFELRGKGRG